MTFIPLVHVRSSNLSIMINLIIPEEGWFGQPKYSPKININSTLFRFLPKFHFKNTRMCALSGFVSCLVFVSFFLFSDPSCDFEKDLCGWTQSKSDNFDWKRQQRRTPSSLTGPSSGQGNTGALTPKYRQTPLV